ncbi:MAG: T9SS type A sorting domain-containing protein [Candidatus Kapabacteria bacterium]|nr:T9SS type A sorting domain-containing protein [Ignavibacteriota bacterium]MCW5885664.1 T9SS type A sorting domain-containing protein [Candidatus Kapabacteria bacterium]
MKYVVFFVLFLVSISLNSQTVWEQTNGPYSGQLSYITKDKQGNLFAISSNSFLFRSKDNGNNWEKIASKISAIAFDSDNNYYLGNTSGGISLFDTNMNFIKILREPNFLDMDVENIEIDANGNIYAKLFYGGLHLSTDKGLTWKTIYTRNFSQISFDSNNVIIMSFYSNGITRSTNNGKDWSGIIINDAEFRRGIFYTAYNKIFNNFIAVGIGNIVYISNDLGLTWLPVEDSIPINYVTAVMIDENGDAYITGDSLVCRSSDGGNTWIILDGFPKVLSQSLTNKDDYIFAATWSNGVICYDIAKNSGEKKNIGIINSNVNQIAISQKGNVFASTTSGIFRTTNSGIEWEQLELPISSDIESTAILYSKSGNLYASSEIGVLLSKDEGQTWNIIENLETDSETNTCFAESDDGRIYASGRYLYYSDDNGVSWHTIDLNVYQIVSIATYQNKYVLVGTYHEGVYFSDDNCNSFRKLPVDVPENYGTFVNFNANGDLFISMNAWQGGDAVFRSVDFGKTFTTLDSPNDGVRFMEIDNNNILYYSTGNNQIYFSKDNGNKWLPLNDTSIGRIIITDITFGDNNNAYIGTKYDGVFKSDFLTKVNHEEIINPFDNRIFPNPASDFITIQTSEVLETSEVYKVQIFDVHGIEVMSEKIHPMTASHRMNVEKLPAGVYFIRIGNYSQKFMVVR